MRTLFPLPGLAACILVRCQLPLLGFLACLLENSHLALPPRCLALLLFLLCSCLYQTRCETYYDLQGFCQVMSPVSYTGPLV